MPLFVHEDWTSTSHRIEIEAFDQRQWYRSWGGYEPDLFVRQIF